MPFRLVERSSPEMILVEAWVRVEPKSEVGRLDLVADQLIG
jgi:hypothetical protein